ncbi:hypothetical protein Ssi03_04730 [Sphaerisporangium siamense]|nr:hypothetical protein Ssi03_04730 [Sphaerisporangium siamense]
MGPRTANPAPARARVAGRYWGSLPAGTGGYSWFKAYDPARERPEGTSRRRGRGAGPLARAPKEQPPRNLSGPRTARTRRLWKAGMPARRASPTVQAPRGG